MRDRVDGRVWFKRVLTWDALLPVLPVFLGVTIEILAPNRRGFVELIAVIASVVVFLIRFSLGMTLIRSNACSPRVQGCQIAVFLVGIVPVAVVDCVLILMSGLPGVAFFSNPTDVIGLLVILGFYLLAMVIAMYPGRPPHELPSSFVAADPIR